MTCEVCENIMPDYTDALALLGKAATSLRSGEEADRLQLAAQIDSFLAAPSDYLFDQVKPTTWEYIQQLYTRFRERLKKSS